MSSEASTTPLVDLATIDDIDHLLQLYRLVYGRNYPIAFGTDPEAARAVIESRDDLWLVGRDPKTGRPVASVVFDVDGYSRIGKVAGVVVHPEFRGHGYASRMIELGTEKLLAEPNGPHSIYTTTRTNSLGPQMMFLRNGYLPLGIFPNAHKLKSYETLTLLAKFRSGVLVNRAPVEAVPRDLQGLLQILEHDHGINTKTQFTTEFGGSAAKPKNLAEKEPKAPLEFEFVDAPAFVKRRFESFGGDDYDRFFPFHQPNFLMVSTDGSVEIYAYFSPQDRYCAVVTANVPLYELHGRLNGLLEMMKERGISYIEVLLAMRYGRSIQATLETGFVPSAIYPAMRADENGQMEDFVVLSRTLEPLNFTGMTVDRGFKPYIDQYVHLWTHNAIKSLRIHNGELRRHDDSLALANSSAGGLK
jgi:GNAT superfamily N-acetyltransferase